MNKEIIQLLEDIQEWMIENDYECGEQGGEIYLRIDKMIYNLGLENNDK